MKRKRTSEKPDSILHEAFKKERLMVEKDMVYTINGPHTSLQPPVDKLDFQEPKTTILTERVPLHFMLHTGQDVYLSGMSSGSEQVTMSPTQTKFMPQTDPEMYSIGTQGAGQCEVTMSPIQSHSPSLQQIFNVEIMYYITNRVPLRGNWGF
jgi:hypothetical protein